MCGTLGRVCVTLFDIGAVDGCGVLVGMDEEDDGNGAAATRLLSVSVVERARLLLPFADGCDDEEDDNDDDNEGPIMGIGVTFVMLEVFDAACVAAVAATAATAARASLAEYGGGNGRSR
jgi:hypothetical protein